MTLGAPSDTVTAFEAAVFEQRPVQAGAYDDDYFAADWREDGHRYELESRRDAEARNPALIKETFSPERVLDLGCGPGFLMYFLHELGVESEGVDFAESSLRLAPAEVRDKIRIGSVTAPDVPDNGYDLVICREVMEHLTVLQVRQTVQAIAKATSRYAYVTTRFHPEPPDLLSFTTDFETDATHITLLNKDFLRTLFVLEGMRCRPDLEAQMDWGDKGRVLVYEKVAVEA
jgi:SAM-dependent methyltransferase